MQVINLRQSLFWDTDVKKLNAEKNAKYIIERIMDFGNEDEARWMRRYYPKSLLSEVVKGSRVLGSSSRALWTILTSR